MAINSQTFSFKRRGKKLHRVLIGGLVLVTALPAFVLTWYAGHAAREARMHQALSRNQSTARLGANFLNAEYGREIVALRDLAARSNVSAKSPSLEQAAAQKILAQVKGL